MDPDWKACRLDDGITVLRQGRPQRQQLLRARSNFPRWCHSQLSCTLVSKRAPSAGISLVAGSARVTQRWWHVPHWLEDLHLARRTSAPGCCWAPMRLTFQSGYSRGF